MDGRLIEYMKEFVKYFIQYDKTDANRDSNV